MGVVIVPRRRVGEVEEVLKGLYTAYAIEVVDLHSVTKIMQRLILQEGILW
jgi:hypothetical protein